MTVLAELVPDEVLAHRIRRGLGRRDDPLPAWLAGLGPVTVLGALEMGHVLGDGDSIVIDVRTGTGAPLGVMVYIDHNLGTVVKDEFVSDEAMQSLAGSLQEATDGDPDVHLRELGLADARARIDEAIDLWAITYPPLETDSWPASRPLIAWVLRHLPDGGTGYQRPQWSDADLEALAERFFASAFAGGDDVEDRRLLDSLLWFGRDYGPGDPLRWSPVAVEILLADWLPRKVVADAAFLARAPDLLRAFVAFSHAERGIGEHLTRQTLAAVDAHEPDYLQAIRSPRHQGPATLRGEVGGAEALDTLDAEPLGGEPLDLAGVAGDVREPVDQVAGLVDACCAELLDVEDRTACRRLLADVAVADPEPRPR